MDIVDALVQKKVLSFDFIDLSCSSSAFIHCGYVKTHSYVVLSAVFLVSQLCGSLLCMLFSQIHFEVLYIVQVRE